VTIEGRAPTAPELMRDFELVLGDRLAEERRRRRKADRLAGIALFGAVAALAVTAFMAFSLYAGGPGITTGVVSAGEVRLVDNAGRSADAGWSCRTARRG
jgi:hypothetical protein